MRRVHILSKYIRGDKAVVADKKIIHHLKDVLRLEAKGRIIAFDENRNEYDCIIEKIEDEIILGIRQRRLKKGGGFSLTIACAIPKNSRFEDIIDKLTQLGVDKIIPLVTERTVVKIGKDREEAKLARWRKIAIQAAQQSQRSSLPVIGKAEGIKEVLAGIKEYDLKLIPTLAGRRKALREVFGDNKPKSVLVFIGPEGDFTGEEVKMALGAGCLAVSLGDTVLRVETAAIAIASYLKLTYEVSDGQDS